MPSPLAMAVMARTILTALTPSVMFSMHERSILILSNGKLCRWLSEE
jgi:putative SOS response-associated peptidase YedK